MHISVSLLLKKASHRWIPIVLVLFAAVSCTTSDRDKVASTSGMLADELCRDVVVSYLEANVGSAAFDGHVICAFQVLGSAKGAGQQELYLWTLCQEFYLKAGDLQEGSGVSAPIALTVDMHTDGCRPVDHRMPRDGSLYAQDIRDLFPLSVRAQMQIQDTRRHSQRVEALQEQVYEKARANHEQWKE
jgi:hypothetical protein